MLSISTRNTSDGLSPAGVRHMFWNSRVLSSISANSGLYFAKKEFQPTQDMRSFGA